MPKYQMKTAGEGGWSAAAQKSSVLYCFVVFKEHISFFDSSSSPDFELVGKSEFTRRELLAKERGQREEAHDNLKNPIMFFFIIILFFPFLF